MPDLQEDLKKIIKKLEVPEEVFDSPVVIVMLGLPGSGKTTFADSLCERLPFVKLSTDEISEWLGQGPLPEQRQYAREIQHKALSLLLQEGINCIIDTNTAKRVYRDEIYKIALETDTDSIVVHCQTPRGTINGRMEARKGSEIGEDGIRRFYIPKEEMDLYAKELEEPQDDEIAFEYDGTKNVQEQIDDFIQFLEGYLL